MPERRYTLHSGTLVSGFFIGLCIGAVMALLWPSQRAVAVLVQAPSTAHPLPRETKRMPTVASPDPAFAEVDPLTISRERGQQAARHRRQELGLR